MWKRIGMHWIGRYNAKRIYMHSNVTVLYRIARGKIHYNWKELTSAEFLAWLGIYLAMQSLPRANYKDYWRNKGINQTSHYGELMSLKRFQQILQNLHFCDNAKAKEEGASDRKSPNFDRLYKIREVKDMFCEMFVKARAPGQTVTIDEAVSDCIMMFLCYLDGRLFTDGQIYWA